MLKKKIAAGMLLGIFVLVLAGCGSKNNNTPVPMDNTTSVMDNGAAQSEVSIKMPEATGDVDNTVDAIIAGSASEGEVATSTDSEAVTAVGDSEDTNNLNNTYDENAL